MAGTIKHSWLDVGDARVFVREAGAPDAPVLLLPHGYPGSSFVYRELMVKLADRWRLIAPDAPGFGYSATPTGFDYTFAGYARWLQQLVTAMALERYALYLHDYGSQFGLELAMRWPERVSALVIQNGDIYEDQHGEKYSALEQFWSHPTPEGREALRRNVSEEGFRDEFVGEVPEKFRERISPDLWTLHWALMNRRDRIDNVVGLFEDQAATLERFPEQQRYLREHRPPTLIVWGVADGYMPEGAARAYLRDLPDARLHLFDGGHWLLETHLNEVSSLIREFLS